MLSSKKPKLDESARSDLRKPRTRLGRGSRTMGKLAPLFEMPIDIWLEIASHLTPRELLALSRTSKHLRAIFMDRSGKHFWAAARRNVGLPEPPQHISEPRLAALLFSATCFCCGNRGLLYNVGLVVRYCRRCKPEKVKTGCALRRMYNISHKSTMPELQLTPCWRGPYRNYHDVDTMNDESCDSYDVEEFVSVLIQRNVLIEGGDQVALQAFIDERKHLVQTARQFSKDLKEWERSQCAAKQDVGRIRQESIEKKLLELGHTRADLDDFKQSSAFWRSRQSWNAMMRQPQKLTPRIWTRIRPRLEVLLTEAKTEREDRERRYRHDDREVELREVYAQFLQSVSEDDGPLPRLYDAQRLPAVCALLDEDEARVPVTVERLHSVLPALREAAQAEAAREEAARAEAARAKAAREDAAREKAAREQAAREQAAREQAAREQAAREQAAREQAAREEAAREHAAREEAAREEVARAKAARAKAVQAEAVHPQPPPRTQTREQQQAVNNALVSFFHSLPSDQKAMLSVIPSDERKEAVARLFADHLASVRRRWGPQSQQHAQEQTQQRQQIKYPTYMFNTNDAGNMNDTNNAATVNRVYDASIVDADRAY